MSLEKEIVIGILWHELGRFKQRACLDEDRGKAPNEIGAEWLENQYGPGLIVDINQGKVGQDLLSGRENLITIAQEAERCATWPAPPDFSELKESTGDLLNIFSLVRNPRLEAPEALPNPTYLPLSPLGDWLEPQPLSDNGPDQYRRHWEQFSQEFLFLREKGAMELEHCLDVLLHLLEKYLSTIPLIPGEINTSAHPETTVSLFDHVKTAAALGHCLYYFYRNKHPKEWSLRDSTAEIIAAETWHTEAEAPFMLVGGDISGIQRFIYTIASTGALKSLKGRSFFLELFMEHVVDYLLEALRLTRTNVIFTGGGRFYLVAPQILTAQKAAAEVRSAANDYLYRAFNGQLQMFLETEPLKKAELANIGDVWARLSVKLEEAKRRRWEDRLDKIFEEPQPPHPDCITSLDDRPPHCQVCAREDEELIDQMIGEEELRLCRYCQDQFRLGQALQYALRGTNGYPVIGRWQDKPERAKWALLINTEGFSRFYLPMPDSDLRGKPQPDTVFHLNTYDLKRYTLPKSRPLFSGTYHEKEFQALDGLVTRGVGIGLAAALKMDVDFLGRIFSRSPAGGQDTLALKAGLSRQMNLFFKFYLDGLLKGEGQGYGRLEKADFARRGDHRDRLLATIYSGGDDLFILGHWLDVLEAALDIREAFARFTANPYITLSAGLVASSVHRPIYRLAAQAGESEACAKKAAGDHKNCLGIGSDKAFSWNRLNTEIVPLFSHLLGMTQRDVVAKSLEPKKGGVSRGVIFRLLQLCRDQRRLGVMKLPALAWIFGKHKPRTDDKGQDEELLSAFQKLQDYAMTPDPVSWQDHWENLELVLVWLLMMMRRGGEYE